MRRGDCDKDEGSETLDYDAGAQVLHTGFGLTEVVL